MARAAVIRAGGLWQSQPTPAVRRRPFGCQPWARFAAGQNADRPWPSSLQTTLRVGSHWRMAPSERNPAQALARATHDLDRTPGSLSPQVSAGSGLVGVRVPDHPVAANSAE